MDYRILGPLEAFDGERAISLGGARQRAVLALLVLHGNETLTSDVIVDELWGEEAPPTAVNNLMNGVAEVGVKIVVLVVNALDSAEAVANETERELGVAVADVGAGTIDLAMFNEGSPFRTSGSDSHPL